jgi:hypothetical protein
MMATPTSPFEQICCTLGLFPRSQETNQNTNPERLLRAPGSAFLSHKLRMLTVTLFAVFFASLHAASAGWRVASIAALAFLLFPRRALCVERSLGVCGIVAYVRINFSERSRGGRDSLKIRRAPLEASRAKCLPRRLFPPQ